MLTRRAFLLTFAALAALAAWPVEAKKKKKRQAPVESPAARALRLRLQDDLDRRTAPGAGTRFVVVRADKTGAHRLQAVAEMHWPPGLRRRPFAGEAPDRETAYRLLLGDIIETFRRLNLDAFA